MLGKLLFKIRNDRKMSKSEVAKKAEIDIGYLTHIEKGERTPSHKLLRKLCTTLNVPYGQLMYTYDKELPQIEFNYLNHISYNTVIAIDNISNLIPCPSQMGTASFAIKVLDNSMEPILKENSYAFLELNSPLDNSDIGLFFYNNKYLIRKFIFRKDGIFLRAIDKSIQDIKLKETDNFIIIGKILGTNAD